MRIVVVGVVVLAVALVGCAAESGGVTVAAPPPSAAPAPSAEPSPAQLPPGAFVDPQGRFAVVPPPTWIVDDSSAPRTTIFAEPGPHTAGALIPNMSVTVTPATVDLAGLVTATRSALAKLGELTPTTDEQVTLADGTPAHMIDGTLVIAGSTFVVAYLLVVDDGTEVLVTALAPGDSAVPYRSLFGASLGTLTMQP